MRDIVPEHGTKDQITILHSGLDELYADGSDCSSDEACSCARDCAGDESTGKGKFEKDCFILTYFFYIALAHFVPSFVKH